MKFLIKDNGNSLYILFEEIINKYIISEMMILCFIIRTNYNII